MLLNKTSELNNLYEKIKVTQNQNSIWKISEDIFVALINSNYSVIFLVDNKIDKKIITGKNMQIKLLEQIEIKIENINFVKPGIVIECLVNEKEIEQAFLIFMTTLINNFELFRNNVYEEFFKLWQLFERNRERNDKLLIGFLGELLLIDYFWKKNNLNISNFYHENEYNKWDFEFNEKLCMEVKTTLKEERKHTFSVSQFKNNLEIIIASVKLLEREKGMSLYELAMNLIEKINDFYFSSKVYSFLFLNKINETEPGIIFDYDVSFASIYFYLKSNLGLKLSNISEKYIFSVGFRLNNFPTERIENITRLIKSNI
ncbi:MAG: hypothetical protein ACRC8P_01875 [Spiroplasma sp.]